MASLLNKLSLVFLLFFASSSLGIHARSESRFFMTTTRPEDTKEVPTTPPVQGLSGSGYGLYGHGQDQFAPATTTNHNNDNGGYNYGNHFNNANNSPSKFANEEFNTRSYQTKEDDNYVDSKQYGMSDTRFFENGRYFYDVNAERKRNQYRTYPTRGTPEAGARGGNYGNGVYGNGNAYKYNNAMEYQNNQEEYVP